MATLEEAAKALYAKRAEMRPDGKPWDEISSTAQYVLMEEARAVIEAVREPDKAMLAVFQEEAPDQWTHPHPDDVWRAGIDLLLGTRRVVDRIKV